MPGIDTSKLFIKAWKLDVAIGPALVVMAGVAADSVKLPTGTGVELTGATFEGGALGEYVPIGMDGPGTMRLTAAAAITKDTLVGASGAAGKIATAAPAAGANAFVIGKALEAATADGDQILVEIRPQWIQG